MNFCKHISVFYFIVCSWISLYGQDPFAISLSEVNGLASNHVYDIYQDKKGFMWFATERGLCRYDGFQFVTYSNKRQISKEGSNIEEDKYGRIWYLNFDGFLLFAKNGKLHELQQNNPVGFIGYGIHGNDLFTVQKKGIVVYDLKTLRKKRVISTRFSTLDPVSAHIVEDGFLCIGNCSCLVDWNYKIHSLSYRLTKDKSPPNLPTKTPSGKILYAIKFDENNSISTFQNLRFKELFKFKLKERVQSLSAGKKVIWACTVNGAYGYNYDGTPRHNNHVLLKNQSISKVFEDMDGNLWVSSTANGVWLIPNQRVTQFPIGDAPGYFVNLNDKTVLVNSVGKLFEFKDNNWQPTFQLSGYTDRIEHLFFDEKEKLIATSSKAFDIWNEHGVNLRSDIVAVKDFKRLDNRYFLFAASGVFGFYDQHPGLKSKWSQYFNKFPKHPYFTNSGNLLVGIRAKSIGLSIKEGEFFFSTNIGAFRFYKGTISPLLLHGKQVYLNKLDLFGKKVIGLDNNGTLFELSGNKIKELRFKDFSLNGISINKLKVVDNTLFLVADRNVYFVEENEGRLRKLALLIEPSNFNDISQSSNHIFVATSSGVLIFNKKGLKEQSHVPNLEILQFRVNDKVVDASLSKDLAYFQNDIEIDYAVLNFTKANQYPLYYRINGNPWKKASGLSRTLTFASLAPGNYNLELKLNNGVARIIRFSISKPWWATWWFYTSVIVICIIAISLFFRNRLLRVQRKNALLTEKLILEKSLKETMLKSVKAQMNPHFFYNSLNTIQSFIFEDDKRNASTYLSKFSTLSRMILEMSEMELVTLDMECRALRLYMELEQARFSEDFEFHFHIDEALSLESIRIPSMLIQPYLENAVKHGLLHKTGQKKLELKIEAFGAKKLRISIQDNGIGRFKSAEINRNKHGRHQSFATNANAQRLQLLQREDDSPTVVYHDHINNQSESLGTTVEIYIPYE